MPTGRSLLPVFGAWVVWVYLLSLVVLRPIGNIPPAPLRPSVRFVDAEEVHVFDNEAGPNGLREVVAELSEPFDREVEIPPGGRQRGLRPLRPSLGDPLLLLVRGQRHGDGLSLHEGLPDKLGPDRPSQKSSMGLCGGERPGA